MVKTGEVYWDTNASVASIFYDTDERPRQVSNTTCPGAALACAIQYQLWDSIKAVLPLYMQGYTTDEICTRFLRFLKSPAHVLSWDGGSFDAT